MILFRPRHLSSTFFWGPIISQKQFFWCNQLRHKTTRTNGGRPGRRASFPRFHPLLCCQGEISNLLGKIWPWKIHRTNKRSKERHKNFRTFLATCKQKPGSFSKFEDSLSMSFPWSRLTNLVADNVIFFLQYFRSLAKHAFPAPVFWMQNTSFLPSNPLPQCNLL